MKSMNISMPNPMKDWVESIVDGGDYASASDYLRDLIRKDREYRAKREVLVQALIEGEQSGIAEPFTLDEFLTEMHEKYGKKTGIRISQKGQG